MGTAASLLPIKSITRKSTNDKFIYGSAIGPCTTELGKRLKDIMKGNVPNEWEWLDRVEEKDLLLEKPLLNGLTNGIEPAFVNGNVKTPVIVA